MRRLLAYIILVLTILTIPIYLITQDKSSYTIYPTYIFNHVAVNNRKVTENPIKIILDDYIIQTGHLSFFEFQLNENIGIILKGNTRINLKLHDGKLNINLHQGRILIKTSKLKNPVYFESDKKSFEINLNQVLVNKLHKNIDILVLTGNITIKNDSENPIQLKSGNKIKWANGKEESIKSLSKQDTACLNDFKDYNLLAKQEIESKYGNRNR